MPVSGAMPSTAARLMAACPQTSAVRPGGEQLPERVAAAKRDPEPGVPERGERSR